MSSIAVITGASGGIGLATTRALAAGGWDVIATARDPESAGSLQETVEEMSAVTLRTRAVEGLMESLATVMREFGVYISVVEPGPVRTAFFDNLGSHVDSIDNDDPYRELITRFNERMAALGSGGQSAESVAEAICAIAVAPSPALRYQPSDAAQSIAAQKLVDTTGRSITEATGALLAP